MNFDSFLNFILLMIIRWSPFVLGTIIELKKTGFIMLDFMLKMSVSK